MKSSPRSTTMWPTSLTRAADLNARNRSHRGLLPVSPGGRAIWSRVSSRVAPAWVGLKSDRHPSPNSPVTLRIRATREDAAVGRVRSGMRIPGEVDEWFGSVGIEPTGITRSRMHGSSFPAGKGADVDALAPQLEGKFMSAFIRAMKPVTGAADDAC
jgi:hypothetical protein